MTVTIVGANIAGARAAEALRHRGYDGAITLVGAETLAPYERPPLSKAMLDGSSTTPVWVRDPSEWAALGVELRLGETVQSIDAARRTLRTDAGTAIDAGVLILATGGRARTLDVPGYDLPGVVGLRTHADALALAPRLTPGSRIVLVGAGVIGTEVAAAAIDRGCEVTMLEVGRTPMVRAFGPQWSRWLTNQHTARGVRIRTGVSVREITTDGSGSLKLTLSEGPEIFGDTVVVGIGIDPQTSLAERTGARTHGGIVVNDEARTTVNGVWAIGDVAQQPAHSLTDPDRRPVRYESFQNAQEHADVAAASILGQPLPERSVPWSWSDQIGRNLQVAGRLDAHSECVIRGDDESFVAFHIVESRVVGVFGVDRGRDVRAAMRLMSDAIPVDREMLTDPTVDLRRVPQPIGKST